MNIRLHIERLVLDGLPLTRAQGEMVQAALEAELVRLMTEGKLTREVLAGYQTPNSDGTLDLNQKASPAQWGHEIARTVYRGIGQ